MFRLDLKRLCLAAVAIFMVTACERSSPKLVGEPPRETRKSEGSELQTFSPNVDVLFVIDDSGSMYTHQKNLQDNVDLFTNGIASNKFVDYHIGVITTSALYDSSRRSGGGVLKGKTKFVDRNTPNGMDILKENIMVGTEGDGYEKVFDPLQMALSEPILSAENQGFYRPSAYLAIVIITDAEDQSENFDPNQIHQFLLDLKKGDSSKLLTYGVIIPTTNTTNCARDEYDGHPSRIEDFFTLTKGSFYGLCDPDYGTKLAGIGNDLVERIGRRVLLDRRPMIETVEVTYGTQQITPNADSGWSYDATENAIVLGRKIIWSEQPEGTTLEVYFKPAQP